MFPLTHENEKLKEEVETAFQEIDELTLKYMKLLHKTKIEQKMIT